jgi:Tol biopolymer transport system component
MQTPHKMATKFAIAIAGMVTMSIAQPADLKHPDWHPNGQFLVSEGTCDGGDGLYIVDIVAGTTRLLYDSKNSDGYPRWFLDGKRIAFHQIGVRRESRIYVADVSESGEISGINAVTDGPFDVEPAPSPDGRQIAYSAIGENGQDIALMNLGNNRNKIWESGIPENFPSWHPNGESILFHATEDEQTQIFSRLLSTYQLSEVTNGGSPNLVGHMSPDANQLVFTSERDGDREIYLLNLDSGKGRRLTNRSGRDEYPKFSPDGNRIAYHSKLENEDTVIHIMDLASGDLTRVSCENMSAQSP